MPTVAQPETAASRKFNFHYGAEITDLPPAANAKVWFPIATTNAQQNVKIVETKTPTEISQNRDDQHGNTIGYFETTIPENGRFEFEIEYAVERHESKPYGKGIPLTEKEKSLYLSANALVPIQGRPIELIANRKLPLETMATGQALYSLVRDHMRYDKSKPGYGNGDSVWACDSRFGNCTDFHSLFISLARSRKIPTKFEIGFPLPPIPTRRVSKGQNDTSIPPRRVSEGSNNTSIPTRRVSEEPNDTSIPTRRVSEGSAPTSQPIGGYHCWAWFHSDAEGWVPVDISEADKHPELSKYYFGRLTTDRITMSVGRDIKLQPPSASGSLNYFVYPHVEIDGTVIDKKHMSGKFSVINH